MQRNVKQPKSTKGWLREQIELGQRFLKKLEYLAPMLIGGLQFSPNHEKLREVRELAKRFVMALLDLRTVAGGRLAQQDVTEITKILNDGSEKLERIIQRIKEEK